MVNRGEQVLPALAAAGLIGILDGISGDLERLSTVASTLWQRGTDVLLALSGFSAVWTAKGREVLLDKVERRLAHDRQVLYWVDDLASDSTAITSSLNEDGARRLRPHILLVPRGYSTTLATGRILTVADTTLPSSAESTNQDDIDLIPDEAIDVLVGSDPMPPPVVGRETAETDHRQDGGLPARGGSDDLAWHGHLHARPALFVGRNSQRFIDEVIHHGEGADASQTRVVLLHPDKAGAHSQGILNAQTLDFKTFSGTDAKVNKLTGIEAGIWHVHTRDSTQVFNLDAYTIERRPGPTAFPSSVDNPRPLEWIKTCEVGARGFWTIVSHEPDIEYFWHSSSRVQRIERVKDTQ